MTPQSLSPTLLNEIKEHFDPRIWKRGKDYFQTGRIISLEYRQTTFYFVIKGSGRSRYQVELNKDIFIGQVDGYCPCPYDYECKHLAAAAQAVYNVGHYLRTGTPLDPSINKTWVPIISQALEHYLPHPSHFRNHQGDQENQGNSVQLGKVLIERLHKSSELNPIHIHLPKSHDATGNTKQYRPTVVFSFDTSSTPRRWESYDFLPTGFSLASYSQYRKLTGEFGAFLRYSPSHQLIHSNPQINRILAGLKRDSFRSVPYGELLEPVFSTQDLPLFYRDGSNHPKLIELKRLEGTELEGFFYPEGEISRKTTSNARMYRPLIKVKIQDQWQTITPGGPHCHILLYGSSNFLIQGTKGWIIQLPPLTPMAQDFLVGLWEYPTTLTTAEAHGFAQDFSSIIPWDSSWDSSWDSPGECSDLPILRPLTELYLGTGFNPGPSQYYLEIKFQYPQDDQVFTRDVGFESKVIQELAHLFKDYLTNPEEGLRAGPWLVHHGQVRPLMVYLADSLPLVVEEQEIQMFVNKKLFKVEPCRFLTILTSSGIDWFDLRLATDSGIEITRDNLDFATGMVWSQGQFSHQFSRLNPEDLERARDIFYHSQDLTGIAYSSWNLDGLRSLGEIHNLHRFPSLNQKVQVARRFFEVQNNPPAVCTLFQGSLREYQKAGYTWLWALYTSTFGGLLADDMGLGKTIQVLALVGAVLESNPSSSILILAPVSTLGNWEREFHQFLPSVSINPYYGPKRTLPSAGPTGVMLTGYQTLVREQSVLGSETWDLLVLDEGQALKNRHTELRKTVKSLKCKRTLILSGTPVENRIEDLWSLIDLTNQGLLGSAKEFRQRYSKQAGINRLPELQTRLRPFLLRRTKDQVALEIPPRQERIIMVDQDDEERTFYLIQQERCRAEVARLLGAITDSQSAFRAMTEIVRSITYLRILAVAPQLRGGPEDSAKLHQVLEKLEEALEEGHSILIFSQYVQVLKIIATDLENRSIEYAYLDGSLAPKQRNQQIQRFTKNPKVRTFLLSIRAGGTGINLVKADYVFIVDPWWNPAVENQAIDRSHRIGQANPVLATRFLVRGTIEEKVQMLQDSKRRLFDELLDDGSKVFSTMTHEEILELFR